MMPKMYRGIDAEKTGFRILLCSAFLPRAHGYLKNNTNSLLHEKIPHFVFVPNNIMPMNHIHTIIG